MLRRRLGLVPSNPGFKPLARFRLRAQRRFGDGTAFSSPQAVAQEPCVDGGEAEKNG